MLLFQIFQLDFKILPILLPHRLHLLQIYQTSELIFEWDQEVSELPLYKLPVLMFLYPSLKFSLCRCISEPFWHLIKRRRSSVRLGLSRSGFLSRIVILTFLYFWLWWLTLDGLTLIGVIMRVLYWSRFFWNVGFLRSSQMMGPRFLWLHRSICIIFLTFIWQLSFQRDWRSLILGMTKSIFDLQSLPFSFGFGFWRCWLEVWTNQFFTRILFWCERFELVMRARWLFLLLTLYFYGYPHIIIVLTNINNNLLLIFITLVIIRFRLLLVHFSFRATTSLDILLLTLTTFCKVTFLIYFGGVFL